MLPKLGAVVFTRLRSSPVTQLPAWPAHKSTAIELSIVSGPEGIAGDAVTMTCHVFEFGNGVVGHVTCHDLGSMCNNP